jgi:hypothetical protein
MYYTGYKSNINTKTIVFWNIWSFILVSFEEICSRHLHDGSSTMKTVTTSSPEKLILAYKSAMSYFHKTAFSMPTTVRTSHLKLNTSGQLRC